MAAADQPEPERAAGTAQEAARNQIQVQESNGFGEPLAAAGQEVGQQSRRQLGPGDGSGNQGSRPADGSGSGSPARMKRRGPDGAAAAQGGRSAQGSAQSAKGPAQRSKRSPSASVDRQRLRDPGTGCTGTQGMNRHGASGGQRRGGGGR
jgi:hypothetical protein